MGTACADKASSSSSPISTQFKYDIFLSFSGVDTRNNFTSHLLAALERHGFHTFRDDTKLNRGENIGYELLKAIESSRISLVVLSKNYGTSKWCLDELVKIMECRKTLQQTVLPIFYNVEPSDVRAQKGSFAGAFAKHKECLNKVSSGRVEKWREALTEVANLSGWDVPKVANGDEAHLIRTVIEEVQKKIDLGRLHVAWHEIGLESRLQKLKLLLKMKPDDVRIVAIWGMGGIGKTTIAKKLYNLIQHKFEGSSFLANIRETSKQPHGLVGLQEQLLLDILRSGTHNLRNCHQGTEVIKQRAYCRKILLILDDVDDVQQLRALAIDRDSFGFGSRIILTTRDISLPNLLQVDEIYTAEELNEDESLELFMLHCFKEKHPTADQLDLSSQVVHYAGGLPLALEVLGSFLCGKSIPQWISAIAKLRKIPNDDVRRKLEISVDSLSKEEKELFLDIACFFVGTVGDFTVKVLERCNFFAEIGIRVLVDRCLVKYDLNLLVMHNIVRDMGREMVRQEYVEDPGKRSRLWYIEDVLDVLRDGTGTEAVKGLLLKATNVQVNVQPFDRLWYHENVLEARTDGVGTEAVEGCLLNFPDPKDIKVNFKAFEKMNNLWLLHLDYVPITAGYEYISRRLLWLSWKGFPLECIPWNLSMEKLVALDLRYSNLRKVWNGRKILDKLKFLYLSHCHYLTITPDFSGLKSLEELLLNDCKSLVEVHESIICLNKLVILDMKGCTKLQKLPAGILMLKCLKSLDLSGCSMLGKFSEFKGSPSKSLSSFISSWVFSSKREEPIVLSCSPLQSLSCLKELSMTHCNLSSLPNEIGNLVALETLDLSGNNLCTLPHSICNLTNLKRLMLDGCNLSDLPSEIGRLISLETLRLEENSLCTLPHSIFNLAHLKNLNLKDCNVTHLPSGIGRLISLEYLSLEGNSILTLPDTISNLACLMSLNLKGCNVMHLPSKIGRLISMETLSLEGNNLLTLPDGIFNLTCLTSLNLNDCNLSHLPSEIGSLISLDFLSLNGNSLHTLPDSICNLACLSGLYLYNCNLSHLPDQIGKLSSLKALGLQSNNVCSLPSSFSDLASLQELYLNNCGQLQSLPEFPESLYHVEASNCRLLERIPTEFKLQRRVYMDFGFYMCFGGCDMLAKKNLVDNVIIGLNKYKKSSPMWTKCGIYLPGDEVPNWFQYQYMGSKFSLLVPPQETRRILGWFLCIVFRTHKKPSCMIISSKKTDQVWFNEFIHEIVHNDQDQMLLLYLQQNFNKFHLCGGDELEIEIIAEDSKKTEPWLTVKKCGINPIYQDDRDNMRTNHLL